MKARKIARKIARKKNPPTAEVRPMMDERIAKMKERMLNALEKHLGVVFYAVKEAGIARKTHYNWMNSDPEYAESVDAIVNNVGDFVERKILEAVQDKVPAVLIFYAKTKLRNRGYVERHEFTGAGGGEIKIGGHLSISQTQQELPPAAVESIISKLVGGSGQADKAIERLKATARNNA